MLVQVHGWHVNVTSPGCQAILDEVLEPLSHSYAGWIQQLTFILSRSGSTYCCSLVCESAASAPFSAEQAGAQLKHVIVAAVRDLTAHLEQLPRAADVVPDARSIVTSELTSAEWPSDPPPQLVRRETIKLDGVLYGIVLKAEGGGYRGTWDCHSCGIRGSNPRLSDLPDQAMAVTRDNLHQHHLVRRHGRATPISCKLRRTVAAIPGGAGTVAVTPLQDGPEEPLNSGSA